MRNKPELNKPDIRQTVHLLEELRNFKKLYNKLGVYPYEIYTLMFTVALRDKIPYGMDIHNQLMDVA